MLKKTQHILNLLELNAACHWAAINTSKLFDSVLMLLMLLTLSFCNEMKWNEKCYIHSSAVYRVYSSYIIVSIDEHTVQIAYIRVKYTVLLAICIISSHFHSHLTHQEWVFSFDAGCWYRKGWPDVEQGLLHWFWNGTRWPISGPWDTLPWRRLHIRHLGLNSNIIIYKHKHT